jgi:sodium-coupled neutral amino acid transporter 10
MFSAARDGVGVGTARGGRQDDAGDARGGSHASASFDASSTRQRGLSKAMLNNVLGSGALALPSCFHACGSVLAIACATMMCFACGLSLHALLYCAARNNAWTYEELAAVTLGRRFRTVTRWSTAALMLGCLAAYLNVVSDNFLTAASSGILPAGVEPTRERVMHAVVIGVFLPLTTLFKSEKQLAKLANFGIATTFLFVFSLVALAAYEVVFGGGESGSKRRPLKVWDTDGLGVVSSVMAFTFAAHTVIFPVLKSSGRGMSTSRIVRAADVTMLSLWVFYVVIGFCGYVAFGANVHGNVLRNLASKKGFVGMLLHVVRFLYGCAICTGIPVIFISLRESCSSAVVSISKVAGRHKNFVFDAIVLFFCLRVSIAVPNISHLFGLIGSTTCSLLIFIFPALMFIRTYDTYKKHPTSMMSETQEFKLLTWLGTRVRFSMRLLFVTGILLGFLGTRSTMASLREEAQVTEIIQRLMKANHYVRGRVQIYDKMFVAAARFRKIDRAEKAIEAASESNEAAREATRDAGGTLRRLIKDRSRSKLAKDFALFTGFMKIDNDQELQRVEEKVDFARKSFKEAEDTLRDVQESLSTMQDEKKKDAPPSVSSFAQETHKPIDSQIKDSVEHIKVTNDVLDEIERVSHEILDEKKEKVQEIKEDASAGEETSTLIKESLKEIEAARSADAEEVLQEASKIAIESQDATLAESLRSIEDAKLERESSSRRFDKNHTDEAEEIVKKIVTASTDVVNAEAQRAVEDIIHSTEESSDTSDRAMQRAADLVTRLKEETKQEEEDVTNEFVVIDNFINASKASQELESTHSSTSSKASNTT